MKVLKDFLKGIIIGMGGVAPGVSGGSFAVMLGVYGRITNAIANVFHDFKNKVIDLFPIGMGMVVGLLGFSRIIQYLFEYHEVQVKFLFIGLMLGTIPIVIKEANREGFKKNYLIPFILIFGITTLFTILENNNLINAIPETNLGILGLIFNGIIIGFGTIVPGVSSSFILMYLGTYGFILDALVNIRLLILFPIGVGFVLSVFLFSKIISYLFRKAYGVTCYSILGFVFSSIFAIVPRNQYGIDLLFGVLYLLIGVFLSYGLGKIGKGH